MLFKIHLQKNFISVVDKNNKEEEKQWFNLDVFKYFIIIIIYFKLRKLFLISFQRSDELRNQMSKWIVWFASDITKLRKLKKGIDVTEIKIC